MSQKSIKSKPPPNRDSVSKTLGLKILLLQFLSRPIVHCPLAHSSPCGDGYPGSLTDYQPPLWLTAQGQRLAPRPLLYLQNREVCLSPCATATYIAGIMGPGP